MVPWVVLGSGAALLAGSTVLFLLSHGDANSRDDNQAKWCAATKCSGTNAAQPETAQATAYRLAAADAAESGNTKQTAGFVLGGMGLVGAAVGTYLLLTRHHEEKTTAGIGYVPGGAMASASVRF